MKKSLDFLGIELPKEVELSFKLPVDDIGRMFDGNEVRILIKGVDFIIRKPDDVKREIVSEIKGDKSKVVHNHQFNVFGSKGCSCAKCDLMLSEFNKNPQRYLVCGQVKKRAYAKGTVNGTVQNSGHAQINQIRKVIADYFKTHTNLYWGQMSALLVQNFPEITDSIMRTNRMEYIFREYAEKEGFAVEGARHDKHIVYKAKELDAMKTSGNISILGALDELK